jgi:hypothetical protein
VAALVSRCGKGCDGDELGMKDESGCLMVYNSVGFGRNKSVLEPGFVDRLYQT